MNEPIVYEVDYTLSLKEMQRDIVSFRYLNSDRKILIRFEDKEVEYTGNSKKALAELGYDIKKVIYLVIAHKGTKHEVLPLNNPKMHHNLNHAAETDGFVQFQKRYGGNLYLKAREIDSIEEIS